MRLTAAKDRTFKTVRPNQGTASGTVPIRRRPSLRITRTVPADDRLPVIVDNLPTVAEAASRVLLSVSVNGQPGRLQSFPP
jgi:hypothetical protein